MGSGLILLVIVGAWLAVLVPMALRSHDASTSSRSADRFGDAMRVLARRGSAQPAVVVAPPRPVEPMLREARVTASPPLTLVQRRRRVLLSLLGGAVLGLLGGLLTVWLLVAGLVLLALAVAYVVHLRRQAVRRAASRRRRAHDEPVEDSGLEILPGRRRPAAPPVPAAAPAAAPAARFEDPLPLAVGDDVVLAADDDGWSPVPVPPPTYVTAPVAPPRAPRVLDITEPGSWTADGPRSTGVPVTAAELGAEEDLELDDILERRKAVGGW